MWPFSSDAQQILKYFYSKFKINMVYQNQLLLIFCQTNLECYHGFWYWFKNTVHYLKWFNYYWSV